MNSAWDTPWTPDSAGREQGYWQKQAGVGADAVKVVWQMNGRTWTANSDLSVDRLLTVGPTGVAVDTGHAAEVIDGGIRSLERRRARRAGPRRQVKA